MIIELRNFEELDLLSKESVAYTAQIIVDGEFVGRIRNFGRGDKDSISLYRMYDPDIVDFIYKQVRYLVIFQHGNLAIS